MRYDLATGNFIDASGRQFIDVRVTVGASRNFIRPEGKPGHPGTGHGNKGPKLHPGSQRTCMICNPTRAEYFLRLEEKFAKRKAKV